MSKNQHHITVPEIQAMKERNEKIVMLTAYDALFASLEDEAGIDVILVGDSAAMVVAGHETTVPIGLDEMVYHTRCVTRRVKRAMVIGDMPFLSFQISKEEALRNAGRFMKEGRAHAVKLEGGSEIMETVDKISGSGIPVVGHIGLTPQSINRFGSYNVQGKDSETAAGLKNDALALQEAGAFTIVLEKVESGLAKAITESLKIPTIGIGSGAGCDGQVLVVYDMLGLNKEFHPKFVRRYLNLADDVDNAFRQYIADIKDGNFPSAKESY